MPESRLNRAALAAHLRRCWTVYLAGALALIFLNGVIFDVTRPRPREDEVLRVMLVNVEVAPDAAQEKALLAAARKRAPELRAIEFESLAGLGGANASALLLAQLVGGDGDAYLMDRAAFELLADYGALAPLDGVSAQGATAVSMPDERGEARVIALEKGGAYIGVVANATNPEGAIAALPLLADALMR